MDEIIKETKSAGRGYKLGNTELKMVCYADDAVVISEDKDNLQRLLHQFELTAKRYNMSISVPKTQTLVIAKEPRRCKLAVYDRSSPFISDETLTTIIVKFKVINLRGYALKFDSDIPNATSKFLKIKKKHDFYY